MPRLHAHTHSRDQLDVRSEISLSFSECFVASEINNLRLISGNIHLQKIRNQANTEIYAGGGGGGGGGGEAKG